MNALLASLVLNALDEKKISQLDYFDDHFDGNFNIVLRDGSVIKVSVRLVHHVTTQP